MYWQRETRYLRTVLLQNKVRIVTKACTNRMTGCVFTLYRYNKRFHITVTLCRNMMSQHMSRAMRKCVLFNKRTTKALIRLRIHNKGADQPAHSCSLISAFVVRCLDSIISLDSIAEISRLASLCSWAGQFESDQVGNSRRHVFSWRGSYRYVMLFGVMKTNKHKINL